jgi:lysophospholipase L1-like esterase
MMRGRTRTFVGITFLVPALSLLLLELGLRLIGFGGRQPLFIDARSFPGASPAYLVANPHVMRRYLPRGASPEPEIIYFEKEKPRRSIRIVVQGGSAAAGFPYGRWGGLAGMLGDRLDATFPELEIEVISTAIPAASSTTLLDFVDEIVEIEPDAVLVYAGHNEYLGVDGVASALSFSRFRGATPLGLKLRELGIYQLLRLLILSARFAGTARVTLMAHAAASAEIPFGSDTYQRGLLQLETNLSEILRKYGRASIPVYLGTLASNEKDQRPFAGGRSDGIDRNQWEQLWASHRQAERAGDVSAARSALHRLLEFDGDAADVWYALGRLEQDAFELETAREAYRNAKDRDRLHFRAPEDFNRLIRRLARSSDATLVDVQRHLVDASAHAILGDELFADHVHPNAEGYFLLADAYYDALKRNGEIGDWSRSRSRAQAMRDMPITAFDRILADHRIRELKADYPFRETRQEIRFPTPSDEIERLALRFHLKELSWFEAMESLFQIRREAGRKEEAVRVARLVAQALPADSVPNLTAGRLYMELEQFARARHYLDRSLRAAPDEVSTLQALVRVNLELDDRLRAQEHLAQLKGIAPAHPLVKRFEAGRAPAPLRSQ